MVKHTSKPPETQLELPFLDSHSNTQDKRPLPLIVASKWQFPLQHYEPNQDQPEYLYSVQDWIMGMGANKATARKTWSMLRSNFESNTLKLPYKTAGGEFQMDFATDKVLYAIAIEMRPMSKRPVLDEIRNYLVECGVKFDEIRRDETKAAEFVDALNHHHKTRLEGIVTRNELMDLINALYGKSFPYAQFTDVENVGLFRRTAKQIRAKTGLKNAREGMTTQAIAFCAIAESSCEQLLKGRGSVSIPEAFDIMRKITAPLGITVKQLEAQLGVDLATGLPLLHA